MAKQIPIRAEGWKYKGSDGKWTVWHAGKNDYRVTDGPEGEVFGVCEQLGPAVSFASWCKVNCGMPF